MSANHVMAGSASACAVKARASHRPRIATCTLALLLAVAFALAPGRASAQQPLPLALPNLDLRGAGTSYALVRLSDGSVIVGGSFTSVFDPVSQLNFPRAGLVKFQPSGALDLAFDPLAGNAVVRALVVDGTSLYVAGSFGTIGGQSRSNVARISVSGNGTADQWNPGADGTVHALALHGGSIVLGGEFDHVAGLPRARIAKVATDSTGTLDATWVPSANGLVLALAVDGGNLYAGGRFTSIGGAARNALARIPLAGSGSADPAWAPVVSCNAEAGLDFSCINTIAVDANSRVHVGGWFNAINGSSIQNLARLSGSGAGALDASWRPDPNSSVRRVLFDGSGAVYVAGYFMGIGNAVRLHVARISAAGAGFADVWSNPHDEVVHAMALETDGTLLTAGAFSRVNDELRMGFARVAPSGPPAPSPLVQAEGSVRDLSIAPDGSIYVIGTFQRANNFARRGLLRTGPDGQLDPDWNPAIKCDSGSFCVDALVVATDGSVYVGGGFYEIEGLPREYLARFGDSGVDPSWNAGADAPVRRLALDASSNLYAFGQFSSIGGLGRDRLAKIAPNGIVDSSWNPVGPDDGVFLADLEVDAFNNVFVAGNFTSVGGIPRNGLARFTGSSGAFDATWNPAPDSLVLDVEVDASGAVYVGGYFDNIGGLARNGLAKLSGFGAGLADPAWDQPLPGLAQSLVLDSSQRVYVASDTLLRLSASTGAIDTTWSPTVSGFVYRVAIASSGNVVVGGEFTAISGQGRQLLAALPSAADPIFVNGFEGP